MSIIECVGRGRARGRAHGEQARDMIHIALDRWREGTSSHSRHHVAATGLLTAVETAVPDLAEEMRGIAEAAAVPFAEILAYNFMDEQWWLHREHLELGCSVLGRVDTNGAILAQNMDLPQFMDGSQIIVRIRQPDAPETLVLSSAGMIGLTGINAAGVGVCVNTLGMLRHSGAGLPVAAAIRGALTYSSRADAISFLQRIPHASGQHYAVIDTHGIHGIECSASQVVDSCPTDSSVLLHTNHPLANNDVDPTAAHALDHDGRITDSRIRYAYLETRAGFVHDLEAAERLLGDHSAPLCVRPRHGRHTQTFGAVAFDLSTRPPRSRFCLGLPDRQPWMTPGWLSPKRALPCKG
ncbi:C45 family autoproteolytic acyltransferase/hydolase [Rhodococcus qingshengii]|uniref:C45 family autoproteolytic acyltransferase/hydolase n=1 Tax=Rhodococcus qingshengii TaxID=334542 RepID=UPI001BEB0D79|nr:C45 family peptidase [Rhodococcus qingshengii]MBT2270092.1 6-aminopenicillanic acid acyl-transferase [Rhodococcus qingshengii]